MTSRPFSEWRGLLSTLADTPPTVIRNDQAFPTLTPTQLARMAAHGRGRQVRQGEVLIEVGQEITRFFVVKTGQIDILRASDGNEETLVVIRPGQFTGEVSALSGRR